MTSPIFHSRSKIWIEDDQGNVVFGLGRYRILSLIKEKGSLQAAAAELKMGYRGLWGRIKATEDRLGEKLLIKTVGGTKGGGSKLTPLAEKLVEEFGKTISHLERQVDFHLEVSLKKHININPEDTIKK
ncbi:MAG: LysR family transcriptional regulator [Proteobacteria bacterium]|nr:LysR family transcriptional regulator [Pseudomonadota bacterium]